MSQTKPVNPTHKKETISTWFMPSEMKLLKSESVPKAIGRPPVVLSEEADDGIRFQFHLLLAEKIYPTVSILLERLLAAHLDFSVHSETSLRRYMYCLGFSYKRTSKVKLALDDNTFVAQCAFYFRKLDELRQAGVLILFHDET